MHKNKLLYLILTLIFITSLHAQNKSDSTSVKSDVENDKPIKTNSTEKHSFSDSGNESKKILLENPDTPKSTPTNAGKVENQYKPKKKSPRDKNLDRKKNEEEYSNVIEKNGTSTMSSDSSTSAENQTIFHRFQRWMIHLFSSDIPISPENKTAENLKPSDLDKVKHDIDSKADIDKKKWLFTCLTVIFIVLMIGFIAYLLVKKYLWFVNKIGSLEQDIVELKKDKLDLFEKLKLSERGNKHTKQEQKIFVHRSEKETEKMKAQIKRRVTIDNTLDNGEIKQLLDKKENRWITVAHSAIGRSHSQADPVIPCQDNYFFESLNNGWQMSIVCDGAGSAKMSHFGSKLISNDSIPNNVKNEINHLNWFKKGTLPSKKEWKNVAEDILKNSYNDLKTWVIEQNRLNKTNFTVNDYASTLILAIYNSSGVIIANIGDGRGGYLNSSGELKALFTPYGGDESNGTIFITSPIWDEPEEYIQTDVIEQKLLSVFLLSDGMEKIAFECSNLTDDIFTDANIPHKKFFFPIFKKIKSLNSEGELKLKDEWKKLLESGSESIKNEGDDKTLLVSFLK